DDKKMMKKMKKKMKKIVVGAAPVAVAAPAPVVTLKIKAEVNVL
ncbi:hypothetical protein A2U01_0097837, partial [Trifolium medium]|nr:hypothetical protein [Trifolium medium]